MANLSALLGSGLKSIQKGSITLTAQTTNTATITAVDPTKAFVVPNGVTSGSNSVAGAVELTNATTVTATLGASGTATFKFTVVEFQ